MVSRASVIYPPTCIHTIAVLCVLGEARVTFAELRKVGNRIALINEDERKKHPNKYTNSGWLIVQQVIHMEHHPTDAAHEKRHHSNKPELKRDLTVMV